MRARDIDERRMHVYMPPGDALQDVLTGRHPRLVRSARQESGHPVLVTSVQAKAGQTSTTLVTYAVPL